MKVSSITLTLNEENNIGECLDTVSWCDQNVVIDEGSTDGTIPVAESYGADVFKERTPQNANSYEILRKNAIEKATNDWILRIDADERLPNVLSNRLKQLTDVNIADVIMAPRMTFIGKRWVDHGRRWWPDYCPVMFRKNAVTITDTVHRSIRIEPESNIIKLPSKPDLAIRHYSYDSFFDLLAKRWRWSKLDSNSNHHDLSWHLFLAFAEFFESFIIDRGFQNGLYGVFVALADAFYNLSVIFHSVFGRQS